MTALTSLTTNQYYQLPSQTDNTVSSPTSSTSTSASTTTSELEALLSGNSDTVDLSPQAQNILDLFNSGNTSSSSSSTASSYSPTDSSNSSFTLTTAQQEKIGAILAQYQNAPLTQDTFNQIQDALKNAGLSPDQLGATDSIQSFNATTTLLDALNGQSDPITIPSGSSSTEQTKESNYMQQIYSEWKDMSTASASASGTSSTTGASPVQAS